jgi:glycosyltransferase involved in cell wall biosynthesis
MRILILTQIIPYPPDAGPKIKTWHVIRHLAEKGHQVILASFVRPEEEPYAAELRKVCSQVHTIPIRRSRVNDIRYLVRSQFTNRPFLIERDDLPEMRALVKSLVSEQNIACIIADQLTMAQFALPASLQKSGNGHDRLPFLIFDAHNAVWTIVERMGQNTPPYLKPILNLETVRVKRYEGMIVREFDQTLAVTEIDRQNLLEARSASAPALSNAKDIKVIPIAVDTRELRPVQRRPGSNQILTLGTLHYPPNADGVRWFAREVFPLVCEKVPQASLTIVGKNPPKDFLQLAAENPEKIIVTGYVPDLAPHLEGAALAVIAVRAGSGMRVRILEMFALGVPIVTTTIGMEGIEARHEEHLLVADTPAAFATAVVRLLEDKSLQEKLAINGRRLAETRYDWRIALNKLDEVIDNAR